MPEKRKPLGRPIELPEAESDEQAAPDSKDMQRADELAQSNELLNALWNAEEVSDGT